MGKQSLNCKNKVKKTKGHSINCQTCPHARNKWGIYNGINVASSKLGSISIYICFLHTHTQALIGKDPDAQTDCWWEEKGTTQDEMVGWHHRFDGHEFEWALGVNDGQGSLACCSPWDCKDMIDWTWLSDWTELNWLIREVWIEQCEQNQISRDWGVTRMRENVVGTSFIGSLKWRPMWTLLLSFYSWGTLFAKL